MMLGYAPIISSPRNTSAERETSCRQSADSEIVRVQPSKIRVSQAFFRGRQRDEKANGVEMFHDRPPIAEREAV